MGKRRSWSPITFYNYTLLFQGPAYEPNLAGTSPTGSQNQTSSSPQQSRVATLTTSSGSTLHVRRIPQGSPSTAPTQGQRPQQAPAQQSPIHKPAVQVKVQKLGEFDFDAANAKLDKQKLIAEFEVCFVECEVSH